jgi:hypothetical protein
MKVVLEGVIYDKDLSGEIHITDRNDSTNNAKLSRTYDLTFELTHRQVQNVSCQLTLLANLENLAAELMSHINIQSKKHAGCFITIIFSFIHPINHSFYELVHNEITDIWGNERSINYRISYEPFSNQDDVEHKITISFNRIIREDQIDDLVEMVDYMVNTLKRLETIVEK